jgi:hypothetical protein
MKDSASNATDVNIAVKMGRLELLVAAAAVLTGMSELVFDFSGQKIRLVKLSHYHVNEEGSVLIIGETNDGKIVRLEMNETDKSNAIVRVINPNEYKPG